jgi:low affinity Fe/Cu permease
LWVKNRQSQANRERSPSIACEKNSRIAEVHTMKRLDRMITVFSIFLLKLAVIYGILFVFARDSVLVLYVSIAGMILLVFYLFGEIVAVEMKELQAMKDVQRILRKQKQEKKQEHENSLIGLRTLTGGEDYVE